jgi:hypothetical protein
MSVLVPDMVFIIISKFFWRIFTDLWQPTDDFPLQLVSTKKFRRMFNQPGRVSPEIVSTRHRTTYSVSEEIISALTQCVPK